MHVPVCSKNDVQGVLRKLIAMHVLREETWRQDNQYGNVMACLKVNKREADSMLASNKRIVMPHVVTGRPSGTSAGTTGAIPTKKGETPSVPLARILNHHSLYDIL